MMEDKVVLPWGTVAANETGWGLNDELEEIYIPEDLVNVFLATLAAITSVRTQVLKGLSR